jgi:hypothetical protein
MSWAVVHCVADSQHLDTGGHKGANEQADRLDADAQSGLLLDVRQGNSKPQRLDEDDNQERPRELFKQRDSRRWVVSYPVLT